MTLVEGASGFGLVAFGADVTVADTTVRSIAAKSDGTFGDGITLVSVELQPTTASVADCWLEHNARAGIASFGATVTLTNNRLTCNPVALNAEINFDYDATFQDGGENLCSCDGTIVPCKQESTAVAPRGHLPPTEG